MVSDALIRGDDRFLARRTPVVTGERAEESAARAPYASFEPHRADTRAGTRRRRHVDHWRPVHHWHEREVWEALRRRGVVPHVGCQLGRDRPSCMACIFMSADQAAPVRFMAPTVFDTLAGYEQRSGCTIKRSLSLHALADRGRPYDQVLGRADLVQLASADTWDRSIRISPRLWRLPERRSRWRTARTGRTRWSRNFVIFRVTVIRRRNSAAAWASQRTLSSERRTAWIRLHGLRPSEGRAGI
jgi:3'-phosphoadenosine 5'-phosphosulfate sulfotransferase (PAPS reductase)/FAD synthetase